jgi:hypothetical protein
LTSFARFQVVEMVNENEGGPIEIANATAEVAAGAPVPMEDVFRVAAESFNLKPAQNKTFTILKVDESCSLSA